MTRSEFIQLLKVIEGTFPVTDWKVRGIRVWPLLRLSLYSSTFRSGAPEHGLGAGWGRRLWNLASTTGAWARAYVGDWPANQRPTAPADVVFLTYSAGRRPLIEGRRYDPMSGPCAALLERLGQRCRVWEISPFGDYNVPRHTPSFLLQPTLIRLRMRCELARLEPEALELPGFAEFVERVHTAGLRFPHSDPTRLRRDVLYLDRLADRYATWLGQARPRWGFVTDTGMSQQAFCLACRRLGIATVEVQHGVQGDLHPSYGSWFAVPPEGYETRARVFWNRDQESARAINRWASACPGGPVAIWGGDPWREMWMDEANELVRRTDGDVLRRLRDSGGERHVLVTLSSHGEVIPRTVRAIVQRPPAGWRLWLRLHPANQRRRRAEIEEVLGARAPRQDLDFATETPLPALLRRMDAHVTVGLSTVVVQAADMGVPSVACAPEAADFYPGEMARGMLVIATTPEDVQAALERLLAGGRRPFASEPPRAGATMRHLVQGEYRELAADPVIHDQPVMG